MIGLSAAKPLYKKEFSAAAAFCSVTILMLAARYFSFYGFKGSDDLHYAFLSNHVLNGRYDMFFAQDIYAGRAVPVLYQALWFRLLGINDFTVCLPSLSVLILLAYVVCFKCGLQKNIRTVFLASSLIYFNPVVTRTTLGNLPDVYIALTALLVFLLIKKNVEQISLKQKMVSGTIAGILLTAGLFVKESIVLIYAALPFVLFFFRKKLSRYFITALAITVCMGGAGYLFFYYINTGDAFFHLVQIKNAAYFNTCSYQCLPQAEMIKRLTVTVPLAAVLSGAYPLLFLTAAFCSKSQGADPFTRYWKITFISLLVLAMYFPFSIFPYVPLCHDMRQFFFLFPFTAILFAGFLHQHMEDDKHVKAISITGSIVFALVTGLCSFYMPYNKWAVLCNALLALGFFINIFLKKKMRYFFFYGAIPLILFIGIAYPVYKKPHDGYNGLKSLHKKINGQTNFSSKAYYFLNNDTKTHYSLIDQFDTVKLFVNFDTVQRGFKPFRAYQQQDAFKNLQPGWLIVSDAYPENISAPAIHAVKQLLAGKFYSITVNKTTAYYLTSADAAEKILHLINSNSAGGNCY
ncbi:MAG: hypothetical protein JNM14_07275 [Ferruginibacter sp.]|nr:hypothetical protein [Ferruginibacter sp.]